MPGFALTGETTAPVEEVWKLLFDPARFPEWWAGVETVRVGAPGEYTIWHSGNPDFPMPQRLRADRVEGRVTVSCQVSDIDFSWQLAEHGDGTRIMARVALPPAMADLLEEQRAAIARSLANLAELAEADGGMGRARADDLQRATVEGRTIAYRRVGQGPPLVLLHGGWSDSRAWRAQLDRLSDAFDVIAWDTPGCGRSDDLLGPTTLATYADAVADLLADLRVERAYLCGLSFGASLAIAVFDRHPHLVRSLVLAGAYAGWKGSLPPDDVAARLERVRTETQRPPAEWMEGHLPTLFTPDTPAEALDLVRTMMRDVRPTGLMSMVTAMAAADLRAMLPTIAVPTLLLYGELDVRAPLPVAQALHAAIPGAELVVVPGAGHYLNLAAPEAFDAEVRRFLGASRDR